MVTRYRAGASLSQYVIIIVLISLALVPILIIFGDSLVAYFTSYTNSMKEVGKNMDKTMMMQLKAGSLGGTTSNPVKQCASSECVLDFGEFILKGIPENYGEFVESQGTGGGTDKVADMFMQIANQLGPDKKEQSDNIRYLANLTHNLAAIENFYQNKIAACKGDLLCHKALKDAPVGTIPGYNYSTYPYDPETKYFELMSGLSLGHAYAWQYLPESAEPQDKITYSRDYTNPNLLGKEIVRTYFEKIKDDPKLDSPTKAVLQELYWDVGTMSVRMSNIGGVLLYDYDGKGETGGHYIDPITIEVSHPTYTNGIDMIVKGDTGAITNFDGALMCASNNGIDSGKYCH